MRIISLVPSLTESFLIAGCNVVARTKFCIHPKGQVESIPIIGGTKFVDWKNVPEADLVIFDKEENRKEMADSCPFPYLAVHIKSLQNLVDTFLELSIRLDNKNFLNWSEELKSVLEMPISEKDNLSKLPGVISSNSKSLAEQNAFLYLIWYKPWMAAGTDCFIADMFKHLGYEKLNHVAHIGYPVIDLESSQFANVHLLLSSEPYPFVQNKKLLNSLDRSYSLVNGESFSWFGIRALQFLKTHKK